MTRANLTILCFFASVFCFDAMSQGRVDSDKVLFKIQQTSWEIDNNNSLIRSVEPQSKQILYLQGDSLRKLVKLYKTTNGTEMITVYFSGKPILINIYRNNFQLTDDINITNAINSFEKTLDTLKPITPVYIDEYHASYYFFDDKVRYASVVIFTERGKISKVRHDEKNDIVEGTKWYNRAKQFLRLENNSR